MDIDVEAKRWLALKILFLSGNEVVKVFIEPIHQMDERY